MIITNFVLLCLFLGDPALHSYPYSKHDFHLILHQMKLKRLKAEERERREKEKQEKLTKKKSPKVKQFKCSPCDLVFPNKVINTI